MKKLTLLQKEIEKLTSSTHKILYPDWPENTLGEEEFDRRWESDEVQALLERRRELEIALEKEKGRLIWEYLTKKSDEFPPFLNNQRME